MTLILNILHKDMSILAADRKARAEWPASAMSITTIPVRKSDIVESFNKVTVNSSKTLAVGIAGLTKDHSYTQTIEKSLDIREALLAIRRHIENFTPAYDRSSLSTLSDFMANEGIATFYDQSTATYLTNQYLFSPVEIQTRLYRAPSEIKVFRAGSGKIYFDSKEGLADIDALTASTRDDCTFEACINWMRDSYSKASKIDHGTGAEPIFYVSTRSNPEFRLI